MLGCKHNVSVWVFYLSVKMLHLLKGLSYCAQCMYLVVSTESTFVDLVYLHVFNRMSEEYWSNSDD